MPSTTEFNETRDVLISSTPNFMTNVQPAWSAHKALFFYSIKAAETHFSERELCVFMVARHRVDR
jgi:hypothetical protein